MISEAGATLRVARLEVLLERVRINAAKPRVARAVRAVSAPPRSLRSDEPEIDYDDFADAEVVEIDVEEPSIAPAVQPQPQPRTSTSPTAYSMSFVDDGLPVGIMPLTEGGEGLVAGVVSTNPPAVFGDDDTGLALHSQQHSEPPTWQAGTAQPTMEQLGNTIGLDAGLQGPALELDVQSVPPVEAHDLEVSLPTRGFAGAYDEGLEAPDTAQQDLAQYSQGSSFDAGGFDTRTADPPGFDGGVATGATAAAVEPMTAGARDAHVVQRSAVNSTVPVVEIVDSRKSSAQTFLDLLDDSIALINR